MYILFVYLVSALSWGAIFQRMAFALYETRKPTYSRPNLLVLLALISLSLFIESMYFGIFAFLHFYGYEGMALSMIVEQNWFLVELFIAVSGILLFLEVKRKY